MHINGSHKKLSNLQNHEQHQSSSNIISSQTLASLWVRPNIADLRRSKSAGPSRGFQSSLKQQSRPKSAVEGAKSPDRKSHPKSAVAAQVPSPGRAIDRHRETIRVYQKATEAPIPLTLAAMKAIERL